ncbi:MAG: diguanylate cyclase [Gammaproteobacteria bacterium]|nr:diguanylate cyclase [Gammaproteobacteria bacterium]MBU0788839.1 diguanylate cyclase [Gammaproteobacteria bacterium]MBU0817209.1 diguanylate cyclase [Gammaproteobacteria bacterium]MBU1787283.1 diguanylate cyclase [Gammaproteobacteria bacterium]
MDDVPQTPLSPAYPAGKLASVMDPEFQRSLNRAIYEASPDGILVVNAKRIVTSHNQRFIELWQIPQKDLHGVESMTAIGSTDNVILSTVLERVQDPTPFLARVNELYANPDLNDHCEIALKNGQTLERYSTVLRSNDGQYLGRVWFFRDITAIKQTQAQLLELANHDALTGAANRRNFFDRANQEYSRAKRYGTPLSIAWMDLDHFKLVNDQHGHAAGDEVLKALYRETQPMLRESELFARIGGEEFAVLMPDTGIEGAMHLAERIRLVTEARTLDFDGQAVTCTISIGVAALKPSDTSIADCLQRADRAMYQAKQNGRNRVEIAD